MEPQAALVAQRDELWTTSLLVGVLLAATLLAAGFVARTRRAVILQRALESERQRESAARHLALVTDQANDIILTFDQGMQIIEANQRALVSYGYTREEIRQLRATDLRPPKFAASTESDFARAIASDGMIFETVHRRKDGSTFPVEVSTSGTTIDGRRQVLSIIRDISDRYAHAREVEQLNRLYRVLSGINSALVHIANREELAQRVCRVLVETGEFKLAWIGWLDPASGQVSVAATAGDDFRYATHLRISVDPSLPEGQGPGGIALRESRAVVCNDFLGDPKTRNWHEAARRSSLAAAVALPLTQEARTVGLLAVYASEKDHFNGRILNLLEEAARDLSFGLGVLSDRNLRSDAEKALVANEARFRALFETSLDGILVTEASTGAIYSANPSACAILWRTESEIRAGGRAALVDPQDSRLADLLEQRERAGRVQGELTMIRGDGSRFEAEISSVLFSFGSSHQAGVVFRDITDRRRAEAQLRKLSRIIEQSPLSVMITDLKGAIEYVNPTFSVVTGYTATEVLGRNPRLLKSGQTPTETYREMWKLLRQGDVWSGELHNRRKNGEVFIENAVIAPVVDEHGQPTHFVALKEDVTTQRRTLALLEKEREVSEMKTRFISVTSHEFRTPMATAMGSVELLANHLERLAPAKREELFNRITGSLHRMTEMLDEVLLLNRMDAKRVEVSPRALDLRLLVQNAVEEIRLADHDRHQFELAVAGETAGFVTDSSHLQHILSNLLSNAVRYSPAGTRVAVRLEVDAAGARLEVEDQGIGIPPADLPRLFQPFERASNAGNIKGTGLGLNIVKRMIEQLGGTVRVEPVASGGTRFVVQHPRLPLPPHRK